MAVTEEVSLTAVPAKRAKPSLERWSQEPRVGKIRAAKTLKKKITEATSGRVTVREGDEDYFGTVGGEVIIF